MKFETDRQTENIPCYCVIVAFYRFLKLPYFVPEVQKIWLLINSVYLGVKAMKQSLFKGSVNKTSKYFGKIVTKGKVNAIFDPPAIIYAVFGLKK